MPIYGTFQYGAETYGEDLEPNIVRYGLQVDWDGTGLYPDNEAQYMVSFSINRGKNSYVSAAGNGLEPERIGTATFTLKDPDGRFDPFNPSSPLYGNLKAGKDIKFRLRDMTTGDYYDVITGKLKKPTYSHYTGTATLTLQDGWAFLSKVSPQAYAREDISGSDALAVVLLAADWPWYRSSQESPDTFEWFWTPRMSAKRQVEAINEAQIGHVFCAADGTFTYYNRYAGTGLQMTLTEDVFEKNIRVESTDELKRNIIECTVNPVERDAQTDVWELGATPYIAAGESITISADYAPSTNIAPPVTVTDFTMNASDEGSGTDLTANFTVVMDDGASQGGSTSSELVITNGGATGGYITLCKLRGRLLETEYQTTAKAKDGDYATDPAQMKIDNLWMQDYSIINGASSWLVAFLKESRPTVTASFINRPSYQYGLELYDRVRLNLTTRNIDGEYVVLSVKHQTISSTQEVRSTFLFFPAFDAVSEDFWVLDKSMLDTETILAY